MVLAAGHKAGRLDGDFVTGYNIAKRGPVPEAITETVLEWSKVVAKMRLADTPDISLDLLGTRHRGAMEVTLIDPVARYAALMQPLFDFEANRGLFARGFGLCFDATHAVGGPYAKALLEGILDTPAAKVVNTGPRENYGDLHPDPNPVYAEDRVTHSFPDDATKRGHPHPACLCPDGASTRNTSHAAGLNDCELHHRLCRRCFLYRSVARRREPEARCVYRILPSPANCTTRLLCCQTLAASLATDLGTLLGKFDKACSAVAVHQCLKVVSLALLGLCWQVCYLVTTPSARGHRMRFRDELVGNLAGQALLCIATGHLQCVLEEIG